jgi:two-component system OmpR family sensor kinase
MSDTASSRADDWLFAGWSVFAVVNVALMFVMAGSETVPFHFVWISLALVYGLQPWRALKTGIVLALVCATTGLALVGHVRAGVIGWEETTEVPLMTMVFLAMVWHVRRRAAAVNEARAAATSERLTRDGQRRFVRFASHELRTPVTVARGFTELIREQATHAQLRDDAGIVLDELTKLERIAARLLTLAQMDEQSTFRPEHVDLDALLRQTLKRWRPVADRQWSVDSHAGRLIADPDRLTTALDSLLDNAVRYTEDGGCIAIAACRDGTTVRVTVEDDGVGIPAAEMPFVFDSFRSGWRGKTGMGLAIVKAVVEAHGGSVCVEARAGGGAALSFMLPLHVPVRAVSSVAASYPIVRGAMTRS